MYVKDMKTSVCHTGAKFEKSGKFWNILCKMQ